MRDLAVLDGLDLRDSSGCSRPATAVVPCFGRLRGIEVSLAALVSPPNHSRRADLA
jgi:hypothetical protein